MPADEEDPAVLGRIHRALRAGHASACDLVPPTARRRGRFDIPQKDRRRPRRIIRDAMENPRLRPWRLGLCAIGRYAAASGAWQRLVGPENGDLHGTVLRLVYGLCLFAEPGHARRVCRTLVGRHVRAVDLMVQRLERDFGGPRAVRAVETLAGDPHRGGNRSVRVTLRDGTSWVYKARPVDIELLLFGSGSMAETVNRQLQAESRAERLPRLSVRAGTGRDGAHYGYIEWIDAQSVMRPYHSRQTRTRTVRLGGADSRRLWRDAGALAAFAYAFGIGDLHASNLVVARMKGDSPRYHVIDAEVAASRVRDLDQTLLTRADIRYGAPGHVHAGFEPTMLRCGNEDHRWAYFHHLGSWRLRPLSAGTTSPHQYPSLVLDRRGRIGYRPYLGEFLDGLVAVWDTIVRHRIALARTYSDRLGPSAVRQMLRDTRFYDRLLMKALLGQPLTGPRLGAAEERQLASFDIPYFFSRHGALGYYHAYPRQIRRVPTSSTRPLVGNVLTPTRVGAARIGVLLQDAVRHVLPPTARACIIDPRITLDRRPPRTVLVARVRNAVWSVALHDDRDFADVTIERSPGAIIRRR